LALAPIHYLHGADTVANRLLNLDLKLAVVIEFGTHKE